MISVLQTFPNECVDCIVTSPPYYGLRDYGVQGQIGFENSVEEYLERMLAVTAELKRVLKTEGTFWLNHGDSYGGSWQNYGAREGTQRKKNTRSFTRKGYPQGRIPPTAHISPKCLLLQNYRLTIRMTDEQQWILRNVVIWHKPNGMPSSIKDRFTVDYEPVFFFTRSKKYWFERQYEPMAESTFVRINEPNFKNQKGGNKDYGRGTNPNHSARKALENLRTNLNPLGRNRRCVWTIPTHPFAEAHFATFPERLIETPIRAGCPIGGVVLDPFFGSGTTGVVAMKLNRKYIGIELNTDYIRIAKSRLQRERSLQSSAVAACS